MFSSLLSENVPCGSHQTASRPSSHHQNAGINRALIGFTLGCMGVRVFLEGVPDADSVKGSSELLLHTCSFSLGAR